MAVSKRYTKFSVLVALTTFTLMHQNCSQFESMQEFSSREAMLRNKVFATQNVVNQDAVGTVLAEGTQPGGPVTGGLPTASECIANGACINGEEVIVVRAPDTVIQDVKYYCSNNWTAASSGSNVTNATALKVGFINSAGNVVCESAIDKNTLINEKKIKAMLPPACSGLVSGKYQMVVTDAAKPIVTSGTLINRSLLIGTGNHHDNKPYFVDITRDAQNYIQVASASGQAPYILYKDNKRTQNEHCDEVRSPLIVQLTSQPKKIELSSPLSGVLFNLLGTLDAPTINGQHQISWFKAGDVVSHRYITLPDASGNVNGIDQMFGDSTLGPDGAYAANGYEALRKWDGRLANGSYDVRYRDGVIDANDYVFSQLRLWADANRNGVAESLELVYMQQAGLASLSLNYDPNYAEKDRFGNEIRMKSFAKANDGKFYLMYDLWFRLID